MGTILPDTSWNALLRPWISNRYFDPPVLCVFDPGSTDFSLTNAWWLCGAFPADIPAGSGRGRLGCAGPHPVGNIAWGRIKRNAVFLQGTNYCALVRQDTGGFDPFAVLVFRGTRGIQELAVQSELNADILAWRRQGSRRL